VRNLCIQELFIDSELCLLDSVVCRREYRINAFSYKSVCCSLNLICLCSCLFDVLDALFVKILLGCGYRLFLSIL